MNIGPNTIEDLKNMDVSNMGQKADPISDEVIEKTKHILNLIEKGEYAIFPLPYLDGGIQIELEDENAYFEIEVHKNTETCFYTDLEKIQNGGT